MTKTTQMVNLQKILLQNHSIHRHGIHRTITTADQFALLREVNLGTKTATSFQLCFPHI